MSESSRSGRTGVAPDRQWLNTVEVGEDVVVVSAVGGIEGPRATQLWSEVEGALELAAGRLVIIDLSRAQPFDEHSIGALRSVARACHRRQVDIHLVLRTGSPLAQYARDHGLSAQLTTYTRSPPRESSRRWGRHRSETAPER